MDLEINILDLLLSRLPLDPTTEKFIRELFREVLSTSKIWSSSSSTQKKFTTSEVVLEDTTANLREVIAFFNSADDDRDEFLVIYPEWEKKRKTNIMKLRQTAGSIHESRQMCNVAQIVGGGVGAIGGLAIIGSILFPPAATVLLPSFLLPAAGAVTSSLAVGGSLAAGAGSVAQLVTSVTEASILSGGIKEAKQICSQDKESFDKMMKWFERTHQLETALNNLFEVDIMEIIFRDLKDYFGSSNLKSDMFRCALNSCVRKILNRSSCFNLSLYAAVTAVTFSVFLVRRRNRFLFQCVILTHKLGFSLTTAFNAKAQFGRLVASTVMKKGKGKLIGKVIASKVAVGAFAGLGIALDLANVALNSTDLVEGSKSEVQDKILEVVVELQKNLEFIRAIYNELWSAAKKVSEEFFNSLIVDQMRMSRETNLVAHEVYQDVLQETRRLRVYGRCPGGKQIQKREKESPPNLNQMEPCANSLCKVIGFFNEAEKERANFCTNFSRWENRRKDNIAHLHSVFESLQETRKLSNVSQDAVLIGGAVVFGAGLLDLWIPYVLLPILLLISVIVTSILAVNIYNGTGLVSELRKRTEESIEICRQDQEDFDKIAGWFRRTHELDCALDELFGSSVLDFIFKDLRVFCGGGRYTKSPLHESALKNCVSKTFDCNVSRLQLDQSVQGAAIAVVLAVLLKQQRNLSHLNCFNLTHRLGIVKSRSRDCRWTLDLLKHTDEEESFLKGLESVLTSGRGVFLDFILKLKKSNEDKIYELAVDLESELKFMKKVSTQLS